MFPNGGGNFALDGWNSDCTYTVKAGVQNVDLLCRMDNPGNYGDKNSQNDDINAIFSYPSSKPVYIENPDMADNLETDGFHEYEDFEAGMQTGIGEISGFWGNDMEGWFPIQGLRVNAPTPPGLYIHNGKKTFVR